MCVCDVLCLFIYEYVFIKKNVSIFKINKN